MHFKIIKFKVIIILNNKFIFKDFKHINKYFKYFL